MGLIDRLQKRKERSGAERTPSGGSPSFAFGRPTRCPECDGYGYLDHLDLIDRIQYQHCRACGHKWVINASELVA